MSETKMDRNFVDAAIAAGLHMAGVSRMENGKPFVLVPDGAGLHSVERFLEKPVRTHRKVCALRLESFTSYVNRFKTEQTVIFADAGPNGANLKAVLDYDAPGKPEWGSHRVVYTCPQTVEWQRWTQRNGNRFNQKDFAEFLEMATGDIANPPGAHMLEIARTLQARSTVDFKSGVRLQTGNVQLQYETQTESRAGEKGNLEIPEVFTLGLRVFEGGPPYRQDALLRYRIDGGKLTFFYTLVNPHLTVQAASEEIVKGVKELTGIEVLSGSLEPDDECPF